MAFDNCRQPLILSSIYGLNKSYTKCLVVGLSNDNSASGDFEPTVNICNQEFNGFRFRLESWEALVKTFNDIDRYFRTPGDSLEGRSVTIPGFKLCFTKAYTEKAIDIVKFEESGEAENDSEPGAKRRRGVEETKKFTPHIVLKRVSFERLKLFSKCIDCKLDVLKGIAACPYSCIAVVGKMVRAALREKHEAQEMSYSPGDIRHAMLEIDESLILDRIKWEMDEIKIDVGVDVIKLVLNEILVSHIDCIGLYIEGYINT